MTVGEHTYSVILYVHILGLGDRVDTACLFALLLRRIKKNDATCIEFANKAA